MTGTNATEALRTFQDKYNFPDISGVEIDETNEVIHVHTHNAKIWVDLPEYHNGYFVKMEYHRKHK